MKANPILREIRQTRDALARETGYDLQRLFSYIRERERESAAHGAKFVSFAEVTPSESPLLREEPPSDKL
jgi:hypothetical protein